MEKFLRFDGKNVVVTGGSGGIGEKICTLFAEKGARVIIADIRADEAEIIEIYQTKGFELFYQPMDVSDPESVRAGAASIREKYGGADILVTAAGVGAVHPALDYPDEAWQRVLSINLNGTFYCAREFARHMIEKGKGSMICISSIAALKALRPETNISYGVSKAAVTHLCKLLASEWTEYNIRINAVAPGYTATGALTKIQNYLPLWLEQIPMHRLLEPLEIAQAVLFLASDAASGITGTQLMVDGGYSA